MPRASPKGSLFEGAGTQSVTEGVPVCIKDAFFTPLLNDFEGNSMKHELTPEAMLRRDRRAALRMKLILALIFALGAVLIFMGHRGQVDNAASGFSADNAYQAVYALSGDVSAAWSDSLSPALKTLSEEQRAQAEAKALSLLRDTWEDLQKGAGEEAGALVEDAGNDASALTWKLLYATYLTSGPKIGAGDRKAIAAAGSDIRKALLECLADEGAALPDKVQKAAGGLEGAARDAAVAQALFISCGSSGEGVTEHVNAFKKSVRGKPQQLIAFRMIARGEMNWLWQLMVSHSKTAMLIGAMLMLDAALLFLLMRSERRWAMDVKWIVILLIIDFLLLFQMLPAVFMIVKSVFPEGSFSLATLKRLYTYPLNLDALKNTMIAATATMLLGTAIAFPLAWLVGRTNLYGRKFFRALFVLTYMVPPYVGAMAWLRLMNPNVGTINQWMRALFHLSDAPGPLNVYTLPGMIWELTTFYYPYAFITISRAMEKMDPSLEEASRISGATPLKTVMTVTLPMMAPSLIAGALLVFVSAASCYGIPSIIGTPGNINTVTTRIVEFVSLGQQGMNDATTLAVFLMAVALIILFVSDVILARRQYITVSGKSVNPTIVELRRWRWPLTGLVTLFAVIMVLIPFATILSTSFKVDVGKSVLAAKNFTLVNWTTVFARGETLSCLKNSLVFASVTATVGIVIACVMSYLLQRTRIRGRSIPNFLITLGSGTPSVVIALGLILTMRGNFGVNIYGTVYIMIIAYLIKYLMMGMRTVVSAMSQIHVSLEECSQVSGAKWLTTMRRVTAPLILPSIAAGWFLIFIPSFYELSMTTLLYSSTTKTIGYQLYETWTFTSQPMSCAMAFGILLIVVLLNMLLNRLTKGEFSI